MTAETDWQRGYRACADRVRAALDDDSAAAKVAQVRDWAQARMATWGPDAFTSQVLGEMLAILGITAPAEITPARTWLDDCRVDAFWNVPCRARAVHLPTGTWAETTGDSPEEARRAAIRELGMKLVAKGRITVNDARLASGLKPWPQDAKADEPAADLASEARAL